MSLINDALKRANESKPQITFDDPAAPPLRVVDPPPQQPTGPPKWMLFVFPTALLLVCAIAGILIGGGGIVAATPGKDVELAPGTILRVRLDQPPVI